MNEGIDDPCRRRRTPGKRPSIALAGLTPRRPPSGKRYSATSRRPWRRSGGKGLDLDTRAMAWCGLGDFFNARTHAFPCFAGPAAAIKITKKNEKQLKKNRRAPHAPSRFFHARWKSSTPCRYRDEKRKVWILTGNTARSEERDCRPCRRTDTSASEQAPASAARSSPSGLRGA